MSDFNDAIKAAVDKHGIIAVSNRCQTSPLVIRRWTEGFPPYGVAQASVLKALSVMDEENAS